MVIFRRKELNFKLINNVYMFNKFMEWVTWQLSEWAELWEKIGEKMNLLKNIWNSVEIFSINQNSSNKFWNHII